MGHLFENDKKSKHLLELLKHSFHFLFSPWIVINPDCKFDTSLANEPEMPKTGLLNKAGF